MTREKRTYSGKLLDVDFYPVLGTGGRGQENTRRSGKEIMQKYSRELLTADLTSLDVTRQASIDRHVRNLDEVKMVRIPSNRMKTVYDFTEGFKPGAAAKQMNMILVHPKSVIASQKHSYIKLWPEGTHTNGDGWLYQNRKYGDLFLIDNRVQGVKINLAPNA